ncbi:MAG: insulinase family protein [Candidatus Bathyarchaeota archaeon]|nr:insulinase family protein [Candidatus Bathyarchaeota archaeon]
MTSNMFWSRSLLDNNLRVLLYPKESANTTQLSLAVEYGSNHEPPENAGVAHFIEHMLAGGSQKRIALSRKAEDSGGVMDFFTDHEYMMSTIDVLPNKLTEAADILSKVFFDEDFEQQKFDSEQKIILNELAEVADEPNEQVEEMLLSSLFKNHPVKRPVGGYPKTVKKITLKKLKEAYRTNYVAENMILILSGNYAEEDAQTALGVFSDKAKGQAPKRAERKPETKAPKELVVKEKAGLTQSYLNVGARTVCCSHKDAVVLNLAGVILGGGTSSRLFAELRENHPITYDVNATHVKGLDYGYLGVSCAVAAKNVGKARKLISKEFVKLRTQAVPAEELEKSKNMIVGAALRGLDSLEDTPDILAYMEIHFRNENALLKYIDEVKAVTEADILRVANRYLQEDQFATAILNPAK